VVTRKKKFAKHLQKCFISHVATAYLQQMFIMLKDLQKCFTDVLQIVYFTCNHGLRFWIWCRSVDINPHI